MKTRNSLPEGLWPNKPFLTEEDLMQLFSISKSSIRRWRKNMVIPFFQIGGTHFSPQNILRDFLMEKINESYIKFIDQNTKDSTKENANDEE